MGGAHLGLFSVHELELYSSTRCVWGEEVFKSISIGQGLEVWLSNEVMS